MDEDFNTSPQGLPWIEEWEEKMPQWLQWTFFFIMIYGGGFIEWMANTRFLWPCYSDWALLLQALGLMWFYYVEFSERWNARLWIAILVYLTHVLDWLYLPSCDATEPISLEEHKRL